MNTSTSISSQVSGFPAFLLNQVVLIIPQEKQIFMEVIHFEYFEVIPEDNFYFDRTWNVYATNLSITLRN